MKGFLAAVAALYLNRAAAINVVRKEAKVAKAKRVSCVDIAHQFHAYHEPATHEAMCIAMKSNGADPACCKNGNCCAGEICKLSEIYTAVGMKEECEGVAALLEEKVHTTPSQVKTLDAGKNTPIASTPTCQTVSDQFTQTKSKPGNGGNASVVNVCADMQADMGHVPTCCPTHTCCADANSCSLKEVFASVGIENQCHETQGSCEEVRTQFCQTAGKTEADLCQAETNQGRNPACCSGDANTGNCCTVASQCTLAETFDTLGMTDCPVTACTSLLEKGTSLLEKRADTEGKDVVSCTEVADTFKETAKDKESLCHKMKVKGAAAECCELDTCFADATAGTLQEVYEALQMSCSASLVETAARFSCDQVSAKFDTAPTKDQDSICMEMGRNGVRPACCDNDNCCKDAAGCSLAEVYAALMMSC